MAVDGTRIDVTCVIPSLHAGGAERVLTGIANDLSAHGHGVSILTLMGPQEVPFYPLSTHVRLVNLGRDDTSINIGSPRALVRAAWLCRRALTAHQPTVVLGFTTLGSILAVAATPGLSVPVIAAERVDPHSHGQRIGPVRSKVRDLAYARADHVVVQTGRARRALAWVPDARISCIANPIHPVAARAHPHLPGADGRYRLIAVGRLDAQKGFDVLIDAFSKLSPRFPLWDLVIHGEGPERKSLEDAVGRQNLTGRVRLPGITPRLQDEMLTAHALAFPSRYEGFPNALAEAMATGLPAVGFRDVSGVEDLIGDHANGDATGLLADWSAPVETLTACLAGLMNDPGLRLRTGAHAREHVAAFSPQIHYEHWEHLLGRIARRRSVG